MDTSTGTFLSQDPLVQATGNSFGYTNGNPLTQINPLGLFSLSGVFNEVYDWAMQDNTIQALSNISTGFAAVGTVLALASLVPTPISPILASIGAISGAISLGFGGVSTLLTCLKSGLDDSCGWGIATVVVSRFGFSKISGKIEMNARKKVSDNLDTFTSRLRQQKMNSQIGWGTIQSAGLATDIIGRKVLSNKC